MVIFKEMINIVIMWPLMIGIIKKVLSTFFIQLNYCAVNLRLHQIQEYIVTFVQYFRTYQDLLTRQSALLWCEDVLTKTIVFPSI